MECKTSWGKPKKAFKTQIEAELACKQLNSDIKRIHKLIPYKCKVCNRYHVGSSKKLLIHKVNVYAM